MSELTPDTRKVDQKRVIKIMHVATGYGGWITNVFTEQQKAIEAYHALLVMRDTGMVSQIRVSTFWQSVSSTPEDAGLHLVEGVK